MSCAIWSSEIIERARVADRPGAGLSSHMRECEACAAAWREEVSLTEAIRAARDAGPQHRPSEFRRAQLMREFDARRGGRKRSRFFPVTAAAAVLLAALVLSRPQLPGTGQAPDVASTLQGDSAGEFVAVPYSPPLAQGESVEVIRTELSSAALGRMGLPAPALEETFPADVLVGQDGVPRAVRFLDSSDFDF